MPALCCMKLQAQGEAPLRHDTYRPQSQVSPRGSPRESQGDRNSLPWPAGSILI
jgi:hypothetical protein